MANPKTKTIDEILGSSQDSESEGVIQDLFLDQEIKLTNAEIKEGQNGKYATIDLIDSAGNARKTHSSGKVVISQLEELLQANPALGTVHVSCILRWITPQNGGKNYLKLDTV